MLLLIKSSQRKKRQKEYWMVWLKWKEFIKQVSFGIKFSDVCSFKSRKAGILCNINVIWESSLLVLTLYWNAKNRASTKMGKHTQNIYPIFFFLLTSVLWYDSDNNWNRCILTVTWPSSLAFKKFESILNLRQKQTPGSEVKEADNT